MPITSLLTISWKKFFSQVGVYLRERRTPWRLRILVSFFRGFFKNPMKALRDGRHLTVEMKSVLRFNLHLHGLVYLRIFYEEAGLLGMTPFFFWGTLLGYVREKSFLRHDYDLDLAILAKDYARIDRLIGAMKNRGFSLRLNVPYKLSFWAPGGLLYLDIDLVYPFRRQMITSMPSERDGHICAHSFETSSIEPLRQAFFLNSLQIWIPNKPERVLKKIYGQWRIEKKAYDYEAGPLNVIKDAESLGIGLSSFTEWSQTRP